MTQADLTHDVSKGSVMQSYRAHSHWFNTASDSQFSPALQNDLTADVCVIGGGINGLSTAYHLVRLDPNCRVVVLEKDVVGFGASGRNAGQLVVSFGGADLGMLMKLYGPKKIAAALRYSEQGLAMLERLTAEERIDFDYDRTGYIKTALRAKGEGMLDKYMDCYERTGQSHHFTRMSEHEVQQELHSPYLGHALFDPRGGQFNPLKLIRGLKSAVVRHGGTIFENSPVAAVTREKTEIKVHTGMGSVRCQRLVVATNAFSHQFPGLEDLGIQQAQTPLMIRAAITDPIPEHIWREAGWPRRAGVNVFSPLFYSFAPTADGRILSVSGFHAQVPKGRSLEAEIAWQLRNDGHIGAFFPRLKEVRVAQTWGGPISITADQIPHVGATKDPRVFHVCGCWGHGMVLGTHHGRTLAELALGLQTESTEMWFVKRAKKRWPTYFIGNLAANAGIAHNRFLGRRIANRLTPPIKLT
jgi:glycine/D-amino acid oxidase-like deaminating enzyme